MNTFTLTPSYLFPDQESFSLFLDKGNINLGEIVSSGKSWKGWYAWTEASPPFDDRDDLLDWMRDKYLSSI